MIGHPLSVKDIIQLLSRGLIKIPEIQREYVWKKPQVARLLDSLYRGYPVGSLLLWDANDAPGDLVTRAPRSAMQPTGHVTGSSQIVLDGQQRIDSLGGLFNRNAPKDKRVLFDLENERFEPYSNRNASNPMWIDVTPFLTEERNELDILRDIGVLNGENEKEYLDRLTKLKQIRDAKFPVEIVRNSNLEEITEIFIRTNSGGTRLRAAELALAQLALRLPNSVVSTLRDIIEKCAERGIEINAQFFLRCMICVHARKSRLADLKGFWQESRPDALNRAIEDTKKGLLQAINFMQRNIGIPIMKLVPSANTLIPLCVVFSDRQDIIAEAELKTLRKWFLVANAFSRYTRAIETALDQDISALGKHSSNINGIWSSLIKHEFRGDADRVKITEQDIEGGNTGNSRFPLSYLAVVRRDAGDWFNGTKLISSQQDGESSIEYHHIFPRKLLDNMDVPRSERDDMANIAFLTQKANRQISKTPPDKYLAKITRENPERLKAQLIPMNPDLWRLERYRDFLTERRRLLVDAMNDEIMSD